MKYSNPDFINTSEAYSGEILVGDGNIVIPYININLLPGNPINGIHSFIDYGYYIFTKIGALELGSESTIINVSANKISDNLLTEHICVGGYGKSKGGELKILCKEHIFLTLEHSTMKNSYFIPVDTPNFKSNMDASEVASFFANKYVPIEIKDLWGNEYYRISI